MHRRASLVLLALLALCMVPSAAMLAGGYTAERPLSTPAPSPGGQNLAADTGSRALEVALDVRAQAEAKAGHSFQEWTPVAVKTQVVAGTNYQFKARQQPSGCARATASASVGLTRVNNLCRQYCALLRR